MIDCVDMLLSKENKSSLLYMGQAGFIIKSKSGQLLAIDLYLSDCVEQFEGHIGFKRLIPAVANAENLHPDVIIATHPHLDHFDKTAIPIMMQGGNSKLFASVGCKQFEKYLGVSHNRVQYVRPGDEVAEGDFNIRFIHCDHGDASPDAVGVIVGVDGKRICETGDTCLHLDWANEYLSFGKIDVLIGPINGKWGNMDAKDLASLSSMVKPKITIPCHFGMFVSHGGSPELFMEIMKQRKMNYTFMSVGELRPI